MSTKQKSNKSNKPYSKNGYVRPDVTYTDQLTKEQIEEKLKEYIKVEDIGKVPLKVHIRYFVLKDDKYLFRMGGQLDSTTGLPDYVRLKNGNNAWSVQTKDTIFYRKMTPKEISAEYDIIIKEYTDKIKELKKENKKLKDQLKHK